VAKNQKKINSDAKKDQTSKVDLEDIDSYLGYWLRFVSNQVTSSFQQKLSSQGVGITEWIILRVLYNIQPCSLTLLAEEIGVDKGVVSRLADRLEKEALIKRTVSSEDRRFFSIELTQQGRKLLPTLAEIASENDKAFFGDLTKKEASGFMVLLKKLVVLHNFKVKPLD
jgi:DNA-binding MarR family transcriptional regulator